MRKKEIYIQTGEETIDESPIVYKPIGSITENIGGTVDILKIMKPVYNFKAGKGCALVNISK